MSESTKIILRAGDSVVVAWPDGETQVVTPRGVPVAVSEPADQPEHPRPARKACPYCRTPYVSHVTGCVNRCTGGQGRLCGCGLDPDCTLCHGTGVIRPKATP